MIRLIGGPPRVGKTTLAQLLSSRLGIGWFSTDMLRHILEIERPELGDFCWWDDDSCTSHAERFYPYLERLADGTYLADHYVIEGVEFLPAHAVRLAERFEVRACFLGVDRLDVDTLLRTPGRGRWVTDVLNEQERAHLPDRIVARSQWFAAECARLDVPFVNVAGDADARLEPAAALLS